MNKIVFLILGLFLTCSISFANTVEIVVPYPPGGTADVSARFVAKALTDAGITSIVTNKSGAQGIIGAKSVADTKEPQHTLLLLASGATLASWSATPRPFDVYNDFRPITLMATDSVAIVVPAKSRFKKLKDLVTEMQQRPGAITYATGAQSHAMAARVFLDRTNTQAIAVPFQGNAPANVAIAGGQTDFGVVSYADIYELAISGHVRILGTTDKHRHADQLQAPTLTEQGIAFSEPNVWYALVGPAGMDRFTMAKIQAIVTTALKQHGPTHPRLRHLTLVGSGPDELTKFIKQYQRIWQPVIDKANE